MKTLILTLFSILALTQLQAQKLEVSVQANSGLFHYSGNSATSATSINGASDPKNDYTNNPLGNKNAFSYGAAIQGQYVSKGGFILGMQAGY